MFNQNLLHWYLGKKYVHTMYIFLKLKKLSANFIGKMISLNKYSLSPHIVCHNKIFSNPIAGY